MAGGKGRREGVLSRAETSKEAAEPRAKPVAKPTGRPSAPPAAIESGSLNPTVTAGLRRLAERWASAKASERANFQSYLGELCAALNVERPRPAGTGYEYEFPVKVVDRDGGESANFVDLFKRDTFLLEAKDLDTNRSDEVLLRKAYGQARSYVGHLPGTTPPYLLVLDVAKTLTVWDRWEGGFGGFAAGRRIDLRRLHERADDVALLRDIWERPNVRDPRARVRAVTEDIAAKLAALAASLEARGHDQEAVSRFLIQCVFTLFAEDMRLLKDQPFRKLIDAVAIPDPREFVPAVEDLWRAMDRGERFGFRKVMRFNGHFFKNAKALPLTRADLAVLAQAAERDWSDVQPAIFGTLLTRALDPAERHRLGAEYTPPDFIERLVRAAVEDPLRERWTAVQADVLQLREKGGAKATKTAADRLRTFHEWLRSLQFLDPACGSGNFLYVTMQLVKRVEVEVINELAEVAGSGELRFQEVDPSQFHGIEKKRWAREIAELTLWIGFHQFWRRSHGETAPSEPILRETGTLEHRDAVLAHDGERHDPKRDRRDPTPHIRHAVTREKIPDPKARREFRALINPREAKWPRADFIVGNPPFLGKLKQRDALGDGYVSALRATYPKVPDAADLVMYWWHKAAMEVAEGRTLRAGLITTQSITQSTNRAVVSAAAQRGARVAWAIADHYWNDDAEDSRVRVAMTVIAREPPEATLVEVDADANVLTTRTGSRLNSDLTLGTDVPAAAEQPLLANKGVASLGFMLGGKFQLDDGEASRLLAMDPRHQAVIRPLRGCKDWTGRPRGLWVIDFGLMEEPEAKTYPVLYDRVRDLLRSKRASNPRGSYAASWWRYSEPRKEWRLSSKRLRRYLITPEASKHHFFTFVDRAIAATHSLICIGLEDAYWLGVLSSSIHTTWALAAGARHGVDGTPRYNKSLCFDAFPFPDPTAEVRWRIAAAGEKIETHRNVAMARGGKVTMTTMYNVVDKLRAGEVLTKSERAVHEVAACGTLRDLHDDLDRLVAEAYGWSWPLSTSTILDRLVKLHDQRIAEEQSGTIRWLRPEFQVKRFGKQTLLPLEGGGERPSSIPPPSAPRSPWPGDAVGQISTLRALANAGPITVDQAAQRFDGARRDIVARHLETLAILGELLALEDGRYAARAVTI